MSEPIIPVVDPEYDVCLWPVDPACLTDAWNAMDAADQRRCLALASSTLRRLTGYRVGGCPITVRPCKASCAGEYGVFAPGRSWWGYGSSFYPHIDMDGQWVNSCGCASVDCSCGPMCEVRLPAPVRSLIAVDVNGTDITADCKIQGDRLVYTGTGECPFPHCQDLAAPVGADNTFSVTYMNSYEVDGSGAYAAGTLAMEFARACDGGKCRLPSGVTAVVRQGVSMTIESGLFSGGFTGIREIDAYIALWRSPDSPKWAPRVWSPGGRRPRVER